MGNRFTGVRPVVDHDAKAIGQSQFLSHGPGGHQEMTEDRFIAGRGFAEPRYQFFWYDEQVNRSLRLNVVQDDAGLILVFDARRNFPINDPLEDSFHGNKG